MQKYQYMSFDVGVKVFGMNIGEESFDDFANKMGSQGWRLHSLVSTSSNTAVAIFERPTGTKEEDV